MSAHTRYLTIAEAAQIRAARVARGQTQQQFARALGVSHSVVALTIERGAVRIKPKTAAAIQPFLRRPA
jgi:transcriptional regulator with XRE-family HTH domain